MRRTRGRAAALLLTVLAVLSLGCSRSTSYRTIPLEDEVEWQEEGAAELLVDGRLDTDGYFRGTVRANITQKEMRRWAKRIESQDYIPGEAFTGEWTLDMLEEVGDEWDINPSGQRIGEKRRKREKTRRGRLLLNRRPLR